MNRIKFIIITILMIPVIFLWGCKEKTPEQHTISVAAAMSLKDVIEKISLNFENTYNIKVETSFAASGLLRQQIEQGAPFDVFASASQKHMGILLDKNLITSSSAKEMCKNSLVLLINKEIKDATLESILSTEIPKISIGNPEYVPAGRYAKKYLTEKGLYKNVSKKLIYSNNVRQALFWLDTYNVDAAFVYGSDAIFSKHGTIIDKTTTINNKPLSYPIGLTNKAKKDAQLFIDYLTSEENYSIFTEFGFITE